MFARHFAHWPKGLPRSLAIPRTTLWYNLEVSATRYPDKPAFDYYGRCIAYAQLRREAEALAGFLQWDCAVRRGDRVLLVCQNSPQFAIAYYGTLRADAVVVPANPMLRTGELRPLAQDAGACVSIVAQDLWAEVAPLVEDGTLKRVILVAYSDCLPAATDLPVPNFVAAPPMPAPHAAVTLWAQAIGAGRTPGPHGAGPDDLAVLPYTSGTTGRPKGCRHTHATVLATSTAYQHWRATTSGTVALAALPWFHVTGMQGTLNAVIQAGATSVVLSRWDRRCAAMQIERRKVTAFTAITTMLVDFLAEPELSQYDLSSLQTLGGGGAAMPESLATKLAGTLGLDFIEGYGLTETMAATHINPPDRPKRQCAGIPIFDVDARVLDPQTRLECGPGEVGEIVLAGPQVFRGYWGLPEETATAFVAHDGRHFFRTGDLGYYDEEGYFFITDRLKRMINAAGFKVWPAEVEAALYAHPAIREACVVAARDPRRGETVKAYVVLEPKARGSVGAEAIVAWARERMAAYKVPRLIEFVDELPKSATGKILWRRLQELEDERGAETAADPAQPAS